MWVIEFFVRKSTMSKEAMTDSSADYTPKYLKKEAMILVDPDSNLLKQNLNEYAKEAKSGNYFTLSTKSSYANMYVSYLDWYTRHLIIKNSDLSSAITNNLVFEDLLTAKKYYQLNQPKLSGAKIVPSDIYLLSIINPDTGHIEKVVELYVTNRSLFKLKSNWLDIGLSGQKINFDSIWKFEASFHMTNLTSYYCPSPIFAGYADIELAENLRKVYDYFVTHT